MSKIADQMQEGTRRFEEVQGELALMLKHIPFLQNTATRNLTKIKVKFKTDTYFPPHFFPIKRLVDADDEH